MFSQFENLIREKIEEEHDLVERFVEMALQSGVHGVKIVRKNGLISEIGVSLEVPYGHIHEHLDR